MSVRVYLNNADFDTVINGFYEELYLTEIISELRSRNYEKDIEFYIYLNLNANAINPTPRPGNALKICIIIDEYYGVHEELLKDFACVFQAYISNTGTKAGYFHFPLGFSKTFLVEAPQKNILDRAINVFYSGNYHLGRKEFYKAFSMLGFLPFFLAHRLHKIIKPVYDHKFTNSYIRFTNGFGKGLNSEEYSYYLNNSKIILCPNGISNRETYRLFEALKAGCIVVSEELPDKPFYKDIPVILVKDWKDMPKKVIALLNNTDEMLRMQNEVNRYWAEHFTASAIVNYIERNAVLA